MAVNSRASASGLGGQPTRKTQSRSFPFGEWRVVVEVNEGFAQVVIFGGAPDERRLCHTFLGDGAVAQFQAITDHLATITAGQVAGCVE